MENNSASSNSFVKQAAILAMAGIIVRILGFAYRFPLTNMIGDAGNDVYANGFYIYNFFLIMSSAGLPAAISKLVSERITIGRHDEAHRVFKVAMVISTSLGTLCMMIMIAFGRPLTIALKSENSYFAMMTLAPTVLIVSIMAVYRGYFQGMNSMVPTAISQIIEQIFNAIFSVFLAYMFMKMASPESDVVAMGAAGGTSGTGIGALAGLIFIFVLYQLLRRDILKKARSSSDRIQQPTKDIARDIFRTAIPIIAGTAVFSISSIIDMTTIKTRLWSSEIWTKEQINAMYGIFTGKYVLITTLPVAISQALSTAAMPTIASSIVLRDWKVVHSKINTVYRIAMLISIPAAIGIGVLSDQILQMLFPSAPNGGDLLKIGAVAIVFIAMTNMTTGILQASGKLIVPVIGAVAGAFVKFVTNYILIIIPSVNIKGAVVSTILCYITTTTIGWVYLRRVLKVKTDIESVFVKPAIAGAIMGLCTFVSYYVCYYVVSSNVISVLFSICVSMVVYFAVLFAINGFKEEDINLLPLRRFKKYLIRK